MCQFRQDHRQYSTTGMWEVEQCREQLPRRPGSHPEDTCSPGKHSKFCSDSTVAGLPGFTLPAVGFVRLKKTVNHGTGLLFPFWLRYG
jgi:hypothetical protein